MRRWPFTTKSVLDLISLMFDIHLLFQSLFDIISEIIIYFSGVYNMGGKLCRSPLHETVSTTATDLWNDSRLVAAFRNHMQWSEFIGAYIDLLGIIRNFMLPDPDKQ